MIVVNCQLSILGPSRVNFKTYADQCIDTIFPKSMMLRISKRLKSGEYKKLLVDLARDAFSQDIQTETTLRKYFLFTSDINTTNNIAFKNDTCETVAKIVRSRLESSLSMWLDKLWSVENTLSRKWLSLTATTSV